MKKLSLVTLIVFLCISAIIYLLPGCMMSERKIMDAWIGSPKSHLILEYGPPAQVTSDGNNGEIYVYGTSVYYGGTTYWKYNMFYCHPDGRIYYWMVKRGAVPPQQINVNMYIH